MTKIGFFKVPLLVTLFILVGCKTLSDTSVRRASVEVTIPPAESYDFMGCRVDALGCDTDCTKKSGVILDAPDSCPKGSFEGHLACFCEKEITR